MSLCAAVSVANKTIRLPINTANLTAFTVPQSSPDNRDQLQTKTLREELITDPSLANFLFIRSVLVAFFVLLGTDSSQGFVSSSDLYFSFPTYRYLFYSNRHIDCLSVSVYLCGGKWKFLCLRFCLIGFAV
jgi:hypothetical protein